MKAYLRKKPCRQPEQRPGRRRDGAQLALLQEKTSASFRMVWQFDWLFSRENATKHQPVQVGE